MTQEAYGFLGEGSSNNAAEYTGLIQAMRHADTSGWLHICFQTDSLLIANQVNCLWACRNQDLQPLLIELWQIYGRLKQGGAVVIVEHIYREHNAQADALANHAVDTQRSRDWYHVAAISG